MTIAPIQPSPAYDANNEAQFRTQVRQTDLDNIKKDEASAYITLIDSTGEPMRVSLVAGVLTVTAIPV